MKEAKRKKAEQIMSDYMGAVKKLGLTVNETVAELELAKFYLLLHCYCKGK